MAASVTPDCPSLVPIINASKNSFSVLLQCDLQQELAIHEESFSPIARPTYPKIQIVIKEMRCRLSSLDAPGVVVVDMYSSWIDECCV